MNVTAAELTGTTVNLSPRAAERIERGHLWVFSSDLTHKPPQVAPGTPCTFTTGGRVLGIGYFNPHSLIGGRILTRNETGNLEDLLKQRLKSAFQRRTLDKNGAARLVFSEADFIPGLIIDVFSDRAVLQSNTAGIDVLMPHLESLVPATFKAVFGRPLQGFFIQAEAPVRRLEGVEDYHRVVIGSETELTRVVFNEGETKFVADLINGQKTGFFLDQRQNRDEMVKTLGGTNDKTILDLFSYNGGWGLRGLSGGAIHATFVDESELAMGLVREGLALNDIAPHRGRLETTDVFTFLQEDKAFYDIVVADPPAFVKSKKNLGPAMRAYEKLNRLAWRRVRPGGILFASSCSYHLGEPEFLEILRAAVGKERGMAHLIFQGSQSSDHPVLMAMPETRYLKCIGLRKVQGAR